MPFYLFTQNNSGGGFDVDDKLCHRIAIEADNYVAAANIARGLGCYWDGVIKGIDCSCCGDRWSLSYNDFPIETTLERIKAEGWKVDLPLSSYTDREISERWKEKYGRFSILEEPKIEKSPRLSTEYYSGKIFFQNVEEYLQFLANEYGFTTPDVRIFYKDGTIKEFFTE